MSIGFFFEFTQFGQLGLHGHTELMRHSAQVQQMFRFVVATRVVRELAAFRTSNSADFKLFPLETEFANIRPLEGGPDRLGEAVFLLVNVDASATNAQPNSSGMRLLLFVELLDSLVLVGRTRRLRRGAFQWCSSIGRIIGGRRKTKNRFNFRVQLVSFVGSIERDAGTGQAAITSGAFRTAQSVGIMMTTTTTTTSMGMMLLLLQLKLLLIVRFLGTAQPVKMKSVMGVTARRLLNVEKLS